MNNENISSMTSLLNEMNKLVDQLGKLYDKGDFEGLENTKKRIFEIKEKISTML